MKRLQQTIVDKLTKHRFNSLLDYYTLAHLVEANIKAKSQVHARAQNRAPARRSYTRGLRVGRPRTIRAVVLPPVVVLPVKDDLVLMDAFIAASWAIGRRSAHTDHKNPDSFLGEPWAVIVGHLFPKSHSGPLNPIHRGLLLHHSSSSHNILLSINTITILKYQDIMRATPRAIKHHHRGVSARITVCL